MGKESPKERIYAELILCYTPETNTTLSINYTAIKIKKKKLQVNMYKQE